MLLSNFTETVWYTPKNQRAAERPARFLVKTLPYRFITFNDLSILTKDFDGISHNTIVDFVLEHSIIDVENIFPTKDILLGQLQNKLGQALTNELVEKALELFVPTQDFINKLHMNVELMLDDRFDDTWECSSCQARHLDYGRNCPYLSEDTHDPRFKIPFAGEMITVCPIAKKDPILSKFVVEAYKMREKSLMPEVGGIGDQPIFFVVASQYLADRLQYYKNKAEEEALNSSK